MSDQLGLHQVLVIEDNQDYRDYLRILLRKSSLKFDIIEATNLSEAVKHLTSSSYDLILTDLGLPDSSGINTLKMLKQVSLSTPIIVLTNIDDKDLGLELLDNGAMDYLPKKEVSDKILVWIMMYAMKRKEIEEERSIYLINMFQQQKLETIGRLVGSITHEFNNIFTIISGYSEFILSRNEITPQQEKMFKEIHKSSEKGVNIVNNIVKFTKKADSQTKLDVNNSVSKVTDIFNHVLDDHIGLTIDIEPNLPDIKIKTEEFEQILINLLINSSEAMEFKGKIKLFIGQDPEDDTIVNMIVEDSGIGMSEETLEKVFTPYFSTKRVGTGMGLYMIKTVLDKYKADIIIKSEKGKGTKVTLKFPIKE